MPDGDQTVADVVLRSPKTLDRRTTVAQARAALANDHVQMLLIAEHGRLLGTLVSDDLPGSAPGHDLAAAYAVLAGRTIGPDLLEDDARDLLLARGVRRVAVVDDDGGLIGLLCLKRRLTGWCSDGDVTCRAEDVTC